jgi:hypothetical protein
MKKIATLVASGALVAASLIATAPQASAACLGLEKWTATAPGSSAVWDLDGASACQDLNAAYTYSHNDKVKGWYKQSGTWREGTRGFVAVTTSDSGWKVLLSDVQNGATVRGETYTYNQYVRYVW